MNDLDKSLPALARIAETWTPPALTYRDKVRVVRTLLSDIRYPFVRLKLIERTVGTEDLESILEAAGARRGYCKGQFQDTYGLISRVGRGRCQEYGPKAKDLLELLALDYGPKARRLLAVAAKLQYTLNDLDYLLGELDVTDAQLVDLLTYTGILPSVAADDDPEFCGPDPWTASYEDP